MNNAQIVGLGLFFLGGMALHGALARVPACASANAPSRPPAPESTVEVERIRANTAELQAVLARGPARTLVVGDRTLVVTQDWKQSGGNLEVKNNYYEYAGGRLVRVPLVDPEAK